MTLFIPDISHHQEDISIEGLVDDGATALIARVGQGAGRRGNGQTYGTTRDRTWARNLAQCQRLGLPIVPYWYVGNLLSAGENARLAAEWVGDTSLPWMLDFEDASGSIAFYREVLDAFARRGLRVILGYVPHWYWAGAGKGSLAGPPLVNSAYPGGAGTAAQIYGDGSVHAKNWADYGDNHVALLQFTNRARMAGQEVDCSAFKGDRAGLLALINGITPHEEDDDMYFLARTSTDPRVWLTNGLFKIHVVNEEHLNNIIWTATHPPEGIDRPVIQLVSTKVVTIDDERVFGLDMATLPQIAAGVADLTARPVADVDEVALAAELEARGWDPATAAEVKEIVRGAFARAGQPDGGHV